MLTRLISISSGIVIAFLLFFLMITFQSFGESRHTLSIMSLIFIVLAASYPLRKRFLRGGNLKTWLQLHQALASCGITLAFIHSTFHLRSLHALIAFSIVLLSLSTGLILSFISIPKIQRHLYKWHLFLAPILFIGVIQHGALKLLQHDTLKQKHDQFFPLASSYHSNISCVSCHEEAPMYKTHSCITCHTHQVRKIKEPHLTRGVYEYKACLNCHEFVIEGKRYGRRKVGLGVSGVLDERFKPVY